MIPPTPIGKTFKVYKNKKPALPPAPPEVKSEPKPAELVDKPKKRGPGRPKKEVKPPKEVKFIKERYKRRNAVGAVITTSAGHQIFTDKWGVENIKLHITRKT